MPPVGTKCAYRFTISSANPVLFGVRDLLTLQMVHGSSRTVKAIPITSQLNEHDRRTGQGIYVIALLPQNKAKNPLPTSMRMLTWRT
jgi:hypothetical protein